MQYKTLQLTAHTEVDTASYLVLLQLTQSLYFTTITTHSINDHHTAKENARNQEWKEI